MRRFVTIIGRQSTANRYIVPNNPGQWRGACVTPWRQTRQIGGVQVRIRPSRNGRDRPIGPATRKSGFASDGERSRITARTARIADLLRERKGRGLRGAIIARIVVLLLSAGIATIGSGSNSDLVLSLGVFVAAAAGGGRTAASCAGPIKPFVLLRQPLRQTARCLSECRGPQSICW